MRDTRVTNKYTLVSFYSASAWFLILFIRLYNHCIVTETLSERMNSFETNNAFYSVYAQGLFYSHVAILEFGFYIHRYRYIYLFTTVVGSGMGMAFENDFRKTLQNEDGSSELSPPWSSREGGSLSWNEIEFSLNNDTDTTMIIRSTFGITDTPKDIKKVLCSWSVLGIFSNTCLVEVYDFLGTVLWCL